MKRDVFSGAVVLNELASRQMAWKHPRAYSMEEVQYLVLSGQRPQMDACQSLVGDSYLPAFQALVMRGWSQEVGDRPSSAEM